MLSLPSVESPRTPPMPIGQHSKQLRAAHAREMRPAPTALEKPDVPAQAAAMRAYDALPHILS